MSRKQLIADLLFWIQIICAFLICGSQFFRALEVVDGLSLSMFCMVEMYLLFNLVLALSAHKVRPTRTTRQSVLIYSIWIVLVFTNILAIFLNGSYEWGIVDNVTVGIVLIGSFSVLLLGSLNGVRFTDPKIRSLLAIVYKCLPQLLIAWKIAVEGGAGIPGLAVFLANVTALIRVVQAWFMLREVSWDRSRIWLCITELTNWITLSVSHIAWFIWLVLT